MSWFWHVPWSYESRRGRQTLRGHLIRAVRVKVSIHIAKWVVLGDWKEETNGLQSVNSLRVISARGAWGFRQILKRAWAEEDSYCSMVAILLERQCFAFQVIFRAISGKHFIFIKQYSRWWWIWEAMYSFGVYTSPPLGRTVNAASATQGFQEHDHKGYLLGK